MSKRAHSKPYVAPQVTALGTLSDLTLGNGGTCSDGGSGGQKPPKGISGVC